MLRVSRIKGLIDLINHGVAIPGQEIEDVQLSFLQFSVRVEGRCEPIDLVPNYLIMPGAIVYEPGTKVVNLVKDLLPPTPQSLGERRVDIVQRLPKPLELFVDQSFRLVKYLCGRVVKISLDHLSQQGLTPFEKVSKIDVEAAHRPRIPFFDQGQASSRQKEWR